MVARLFAGIFCVAASLSPSGHAADFAAPETPPGVTIEPAVHAAAMEAGKPNSTVPAHFTNADGLTLYTFAGDAPGQSACAGGCAAAWPALAAPADAKPVGDWSVISRGDGGRQWAYRGKALYRSARDDAPGVANGKGAEGGQWQLAEVAQTPDEIPAPAAITVRPIGNAQGDVLVDDKGMTLYIFDGDTEAGKSACVAACAKLWPPLAAAGLGKPIGDWSLIRRDDGMTQWAFRGKPLYRFTGDGKPGEAKGAIEDAHWHPAAVRRYFMPPEVTLRLNGGNAVLATAQGMTLYARDKFRFSFGSYSVNDGPPPTPATGRSIGPQGCEDDCAKVWTPLKAASDAMPSGFWSIALRDDGARQWAYQGYPVYTNARDTKPGDMLGRDLFDLTDGSNALYWRVVTP